MTWQDDARDVLRQRLAFQLARDREAEAGPTGSWTQRWVPFVCKHTEVRCVHGDEILARRYRRQVCMACGRSLRGPLPIQWLLHRPTTPTARRHPKDNHVTEPSWVAAGVRLFTGKAGEVLPHLEADSVQCVVTSPPYYGLRDYGVDGQLGLEPTPREYVDALVVTLHELKRVLRVDGVLWLNLGDSYSGPPVGRYNGGGGILAGRDRTGHKSREGQQAAQFDRSPKNLLGIPWRVAFAMQDDGWILRNEVIWHKPNAMPESVTDRLSNRHEHLFLFSQQRRYRFNLDEIREPHVTKATGHVFGGANKAKQLAARGSRDGGTARRSGNRYITPPAGGRNPGDVWSIDDEHTGVDLAQDERGGRSWAQRKAAGELGRHGLAGQTAVGGKGGFTTPVDGSNPGDVWSISTTPYSGAHFATFPPELARRCILAGSSVGDTVLDPFAGSGTTLMVAREQGRDSVGIELDPACVPQIQQRVRSVKVK